MPLMRMLEDAKSVFPLQAKEPLPKASGNLTPGPQVRPLSKERVMPARVQSPACRMPFFAARASIGFALIPRFFALQVLPPSSDRRTPSFVPANTAESDARRE